MLQTIHSYWAYLVLVFLTIATFNALYKFLTDKPYVGKDFSLALTAFILMHIQLLLGIILFFSKGYFDELSIGEIMKTPALRRLVIEHPTTMIIAVVLLTIGYSKHKKKLVSRPKFKLLAIFYSLALVLILTMIPWKTWLGI